MQKVPHGAGMMNRPPMKPQERPPIKQEQYTEYKLRVPRNLVKKYNVMNLKTPRPVKIEDIKEANMVRKTKKQVYIEEEGTSMPQYGGGSVYNFDRKEEARRKRRGYITKVIKQDDLPYALRLGGKGGKRYTGRKEPILEHSAYYILTQCPDGVFEAVPVEAWYNFLPDIDYSTLTSDEVEQEFSKRDRTLSYFTKKYQFGASGEEDDGSKVRRKDDDHGLIIHDDEIDQDDQEMEMEEGSDDEKQKKKPTKKGKDMFRGKKKKDQEGSGKDSDEEEEDEFLESKEVDYMSESSSEDELIQIDDEPDPEKDNKSKAKDDLNLFADSDDEDEQDENELNDAGKELKAILKKESGAANASSDEEDDDDEEDEEDIDKEYSKSAVFMQGKDGKKKKGKSGSNSGSQPSSRSTTPVQVSDQTETNTQGLKSIKEAGLKRSHERGSPSPQSKKQKLGSIVTGKRDSPLIHSSKVGSRSGTPSDSGTLITEDAIRRYLTHKPMTTTDLMRKFKLKKTGLSKAQTVSAIAAILKKLQPDQEKIEGTLYLSIKTKK